MNCIGIITNQHKVDMFKEKLIENGFVNFTMNELKGDLMMFAVEAENNHRIGEICSEVETHFKNLKK